MIVNRRNLLDALTVASRVARTNENPIFTGVQVDSTGITAMNSDMAIHCPLTIRGDELEPVLVYPVRFLNALRAIPDDDVQLVHVGGSLVVHGEAGACDMVIVPELLPPFPPTKCDSMVAGDVFLDAVKRVSYATAGAEQSPAYSCIHLLSDGDDTIIEAFNTYQGARQRLGEAVGVKDALIPADALTLLAKASRAGDKLGWAISEDGNAEFSLPGIELRTRTVDAPFPDLRRLIRPEHHITVTTSVREMTTAMRMARACVPDSSVDSVPLVMTVRDDSVEFSAKTEEGNFSHVIEADIHGDAGYEVGFVPRFLYETLGAFAGESIQFGCAQNPMHPVIVTDPDDDSFFSACSVRAAQ